MMPKFPLSICSMGLLFASSTLFAGVTQVTLPRIGGRSVALTVHTPNAEGVRPTIVVAPGSSCNSAGPLFEKLGRLGAEAGYVVVRFEWSYCSTEKREPSADLRAEYAEMYDVLTYARARLDVDRHRIILSGKSLGSFVAYELFQKKPLVLGGLFFTPVCTASEDENGNPLSPPISVAETNYPNLRKEPRPMAMVLGNQDALCSPAHLAAYVNGGFGNVTTLLVEGNHGLSVGDRNNPEDQMRSLANIERAVRGALTWASGVIAAQLQTR